MSDVFTKEKRSIVMAAIKSRRNERTEMRLARILRKHGVCGWRRHQELPGRPDFIFRSERLALFVDGCFWHGCPTHGHDPHSNRDYWIPKLKRNRARDRRVSKELREIGWKVVRFWEHELRNEERVVRRILTGLGN